MAELEVSEDESGTDDSGITEDSRIINNGVDSGKDKQCVTVCDGSLDKSRDGALEEEQNQENALSFLQQLDARIKSSKKESEKLR